MAKRQGFWADLQRERARKQRELERANRRALQEQKDAQRAAERRRRAAEAAASANKREQKRIHVEGRKAEAAMATADIESRIAELDSVLVEGVARKTRLTFAALKQKPDVRPFDARGLDRPKPPPRWEDFVPEPIGWLDRLTGGTVRHQRHEEAAKERYERAKQDHAAEESRRVRELDELRRTHDRDVAEKTAAAKRANAQVEQREQAFHAAEPEAVEWFFTEVLVESPYPAGFPHRTRVRYRAESREFVVEYELPPQKIVPNHRGFRYVQARDEMDTLARPSKEIRDRYAQLLAQVALRTIHEIFRADPIDLVETVTFVGRLSATDKATGQSIRPMLVTVSAPKDKFSTFVLTDLDPVVCLKHLNALVSPHPYDLEGVEPVVNYDALLAMHDFIDGGDAVASLDSRTDLLEVSPQTFETLTKQLFEAMGMHTWQTVESGDDGVDAVAKNPDPVFGGVCVIQAKRYRRGVGPEHLRALAGAMEDKHATTGILVTTSWVTKGGRDFAERHGRMQILESREVKQLFKKHLNLDVLISLPTQPPPGRKG